MGNDSTIIISLIAVIIIVIWVLYAVKPDKKIIQEDLTKKGHQFLGMKPIANPGLGGRFDRFYSVLYREAEGVEVSRICKITLQREIYWVIDKHVLSNEEYPEGQPQ